MNMTSAQARKAGLRESGGQSPQALKPREQCRVINGAPCSPTMAKITLPYPPSLNNLYATRGRRRVLTTKGRKYHDAVIARAIVIRLPMLEGELSVDVKLYRPAKRGDLDNSLKIILDSLTSLAWRDDKQVKVIHAERFEDRCDPRAIVTISKCAA